MRVLITGASGFVGGALFERLRREGATVLGLGRRKIASADYVSCDLSQGLAIDFTPDVVVHAAARSSPWGSKQEFHQQNVVATRKLITFCESHGRPHLVHLSSAAVMYADMHQYAMTEQTPLPPRPINTYAASKREAEHWVTEYAGPWTILRPRAVFGPGDTVVFPRILRAARRGRLPLIESEHEVLGDVIYIDTLVDYLLRAIERRTTGLYLVTNNQPVPILQFLLSIFSRLGLAQPSRRIPVARAMAAAQLVERVYGLLPFLGEPPLTRFGVSVFAYSKTFDVTKSLRDLGPPSVALSEGVDRFVSWQKKQWNHAGEHP